MSTRSTATSHRERRSDDVARLDVYLLPAVVGGGLGDLEELRLAGRRLRLDGHRVVRLLRGPGPGTAEGEAGFDWTGIPRVRGPTRRSRRALTISSQFGVTAAEGRDEPYGSPGERSPERALVERAYGTGRTLHVSLEEFARALTSAESLREGRREAGGGRSTSAVPEAERAAFQRLYRKHRAFDRRDLLPLFPGFRYRPAFAKEFPESVQCGPLWPEAPPRRPGPGPAGGPLTVLWYASPSSSGRIAEPLAAGLARTGRPTRLVVRSPRELPIRSRGAVQVEHLGPGPRATWLARMASSDLTICTGTRTLLEALRAGRPFLYFNGVLGSGGRTRRHRPEKIDELLRLARRAGIGPRARRAWSDFSRGRRVAALASGAPGDGSLAVTKERLLPWIRYPPGFEDAGELIASVAQRFGRPTTELGSLLASVRAESRGSARFPAGRARSKV